MRRHRSGCAATGSAAEIRDSGRRRPSSVAALTAQDRPQAFDVSRIRATLCDQSRSCHPETMKGLEAPSAISTWAPVIAATELAPNAIEAGVRTVIGKGPIRSPIPGARIPMEVANANASKVAISPIHSPPMPAAWTASAISIASRSGRSSQNGRTASIGDLTASPPQRPDPAGCAGQFARRLVHLEVRGSGERIAQASLQRCAVVNRAAPGEVVHRSDDIGRDACPVRRGEPQPGACRQRHRGPSRLACQAVSMAGSNRLARLRVPTRPWRRPPGWWTVRRACGWLPHLFWWRRARRSRRSRPARCPSRPR